MKNYLLMGVFLVSINTTFASELIELLALGNRVDRWHTNYCVDNKASTFLETIGSKTFVRATREYNRCSDTVRNVIWNKVVVQENKILAATLSLISLDAGVRQNVLSQMDDIFNYPEVRKKFCEEMSIGKALEWYAYVDGKNIVTRCEFRLQQQYDGEAHALQKRHVFRFKIAKEKDKDCFYCMTKEDVFCQLTPEALIALEPQTRDFFNTFESKGQRRILVTTETDGMSRILLTKILNDRGDIENDYGPVSKKACKGILQLAEKGYLGVDSSHCLVNCKYEERLSKMRTMICDIAIPFAMHYFARQHFRMVESPEAIIIEKTNKRLEALELLGEGPYIKHAPQPLLMVDSKSTSAYAVKAWANYCFSGLIQCMLCHHSTKKSPNVINKIVNMVMNCFVHCGKGFGISVGLDILSDSCGRGAELLWVFYYLANFGYSWSYTGMQEGIIPLKDAMHEWVAVY